MTKGETSWAVDFTSVSLQVPLERRANQILSGGRFMFLSQLLALMALECLERTQVLIILVLSKRRSAVILMWNFFSGFKEDFQMDVFKVLAAILHLGNVQIMAVGNERSSVSVRRCFVSPSCVQRVISRVSCRYPASAS